MLPPVPAVVRALVWLPGTPCTDCLSSLSNDGALFQCFRQFRPWYECLFGFLIRHPLSSSLVLLRPVIGLFLNAEAIHVKEASADFGYRINRQVLPFPSRNGCTSKFWKTTLLPMKNNNKRSRSELPLLVLQAVDSWI